jgi:pyruvyl transferase EpsO
MTSPTDRTAAALDGLRARFDATLATHLAGARRVALLDFPYYDNVGDSAIWLGEVHALRRLGVRVVYAADHLRFREEQVDALPADVPLLLSGGGNFGDLWEHHQRFRERVAVRFPGRRVLQLPQSIHFRAPGAAERSAETLRAHPDLTVLVRDADSLAQARDGLGLRTDLCPDAAFGIDAGFADRWRTAADRPVLELWRRDDEARDPVAGDGGHPGVDWYLPRNRRRRATNAANKAIRTAGSGPLARRAVAANLDRLAHAEVRRGVELLAHGRVVATDRLHAVILSTLIGRPHVAVENSYGKIGRVHRAWLEGSALTRFAATRDQARADAVAWARA